MYYPYLRGKQFELLAVREMASILAKAKFCPIIEPIRESLKTIERALDAVCAEDGGNVIVIINPQYGDHKDDASEIAKLLKTKYLGKDGIKAGILLSNDTNLEEAKNLFKAYKEHNPVFIHAGFTQPKEFANYFNEHSENLCNIFIGGYHNSLYRRRINKGKRIIIQDGFHITRNADYPKIEPFSELHLTYNNELDMDGFGDFLIVGDEFREGGGPAYAVAIHITFIDPNNDNEMYVYHFVSDEKDTPADPAGKFKQALDKLIDNVDHEGSYILKTKAIKEFRTIHKIKHFPGLGYVKKLSLMHHIETLAHYFETQGSYVK